MNLFKINNRYFASNAPTQRYSLLKQPLLNTLNSHLIDYPTPSNLNISWNGGSLAGILLMSQIITGIFLAMHYTAHVDLAFSSVQHIMRDVPSGWLLRYAHANGASLFFIVVYLHVFRGLYYSSYARPRELVWIIGVVILLLMIMTAFIGYIGQKHIEIDNILDLNVCCVSFIDTNKIKSYELLLKKHNITPIKIYENSAVCRNNFIVYKKQVEVYVWFNNKNDRCYVGSGVNLHRRLNQYYYNSVLKKN